MLLSLLIVMFIYIAMSKEKVGFKQFQWLPSMHTTMLTLLAEKTVKGNKPSNTFKAGSFATVAKAISEKFEVKCYPTFVENWRWTLRTMWSSIQELCKKSGFGWNDNLKMITCDAKTYQEEVMVCHWNLYVECMLLLLHLRCIMPLMWINIEIYMFNISKWRWLHVNNDYTRCGWMNCVFFFFSYRLIVNMLNTWTKGGDFWQRMLSFKSFGWMISFLLNSNDLGWWWLRIVGFLWQYHLCDKYVLTINIGW